MGAMRRWFGSERDRERRVHVQRRLVDDLFPRKRYPPSARHLVDNPRVLELFARRLGDEELMVGVVLDAVRRERRVLQREDHMRLRTAHLHPRDKVREG